MNWDRSYHHILWDDLDAPRSPERDVQDVVSSCRRLFRWHGDMTGKFTMKKKEFTNWLMEIWRCLFFLRNCCISTSVNSWISWLEGTFHSPFWSVQLFKIPCRTLRLSFPFHLFHGCPTLVKTTQVRGEKGVIGSRILPCVWVKYTP